MDVSLTYQQQIYKTPIDISAKFALIGNNIDGFVGVKTMIFESYSDLKAQLPAVLVGLQCYGEWNLTLYQYYGDVQIKEEYGYYKSLENGTVLFKYDYMHLPIVHLHFFENRMEMVCAAVEASENWDADADDFEQYEVYTEIITLEFI
jgi:hypothetical protein